MSSSLKNEDEYLKKEFAYELLQNLFGLHKQTLSKNEALEKFAKEILEEWKKKIVPIKHALKMFEFEGVYY